MRTLEYSALTAPLEKQDFIGVPNDPASKGGKIAIGIGAAVLSVALTLSIIVGMTALANGEGIGPLFSGLAISSLLLLIGIGAVYGLILQRRRIARMRKFAQANGISYEHDIPPVGYEGLIFDEGHSREITETLKFPDGVEVGNYRYVTGSGKNRSTHNFGFARIALSRHVPHMVLDAKKNNFLSLTNLPDSFDRSQRLTLEGDFNDYFDVYVPQEYERDALYVFTPDVMQALIQHGRKFDIEVIDNELYLYSTMHTNLTSEEALKELLTVVATLREELLDQTRRYSDERVVGVQAGTAVAETGRRLKKGWNPVIVTFFVLIVAYNFAGAFLPPAISGFLALGVFALIATVTLASIGKAIRQRTR